MSETTGESLAALPEVFRFSDALERVSERQLRRLVAEGRVTVLARGLYAKGRGVVDEDLVEIAARSPLATLCMRSALARHGLIDDIPAEIDVAVPRGAWTPAVGAPVRWRHFDPDTFEVGRDLLAIGGGRSIGIYSGERSIIDAFRLAHIDGGDLANEALKRWLRGGGQPARLLAMAQAFPRTLTGLRETMAILL